MLSSFVEARALQSLDWLTPEHIRDELLVFDELLARASERSDALGRYARAARPILPLWSKANMIWFDYDNPGYIEFDDKLRMALNPQRVVPWWLGRPAEWPRFRGEELKKAFRAFMVGLVCHDVTHFLIWIAHRRLPNFHTIWLGEELNCTLWGTTMSTMAIGNTIPPDLDDPQVQDFVVETAQLPIRAVHMRDYLNDRASMFSEGAALDSMFAPVPAAMKLMQSAVEMVPEHPAASRAYKRFAKWAWENKADALGEGEVMRWRGHEGVERFDPLKPTKRKRAG